MWEILHRHWFSRQTKKTWNTQSDYDHQGDWWVSRATHFLVVIVAWILRTEAIMLTFFFLKTLFVVLSPFVVVLLLSCKSYNSMGKCLTPCLELSERAFYSIFNSYSNRISRKISWKATSSETFFTSFFHPVVTDSLWPISCEPTSLCILFYLQWQRSIRDSSVDVYSKTCLISKTTIEENERISQRIIFSVREEKSSHDKDLVVGKQETQQRRFFNQRLQEEDTQEEHFLTSNCSSASFNISFSMSSHLILILHQRDRKRYKSIMSSWLSKNNSLLKTFASPTRTLESRKDHHHYLDHHHHLWEE